MFNSFILKLWEIHRTLACKQFAWHNQMQNIIDLFHFSKKLQCFYAEPSLTEQNTNFCYDKPFTSGRWKDHKVWIIMHSFKGYREGSEKMDSILLKFPTPCGHAFFYCNQTYQCWSNNCSCQSATVHIECVCVCVCVWLEPTSHSCRSS